ncbi:MAG: hypothetical protein AAB677_02905 [Patescibacteria group bacterium]
METLTIPKKLANQGDLVLISRHDYEQLVSNSVKEIIKRDPKIDRELAIAMKEYREGKIEGPFNTAEDFMVAVYRRNRHSTNKK